MSWWTVVRKGQRAKAMLIGHIWCRIWGQTFSPSYGYVQTQQGSGREWHASRHQIHLLCPVYMQMHKAACDWILVVAEYWEADSMKQLNMVTSHHLLWSVCHPGHAINQECKQIATSRDSPGKNSIIITETETFQLMMDHAINLGACVRQHWFLAKSRFNCQRTHEVS